MAESWWPRRSSQCVSNQLAFLHLCSNIPAYVVDGNVSSRVGGSPARLTFEEGGRYRAFCINQRRGEVPSPYQTYVHASWSRRRTRARPEAKRES